MDENMENGYNQPANDQQPNGGYQQQNNYYQPQPPVYQQVVYVQPKKKKKGLALFIVACVFFGIATIIDGFWTIVWVDLFQKLNSGASDLGEALGLIFGLIFFIAYWIISCPIPSIVAIILTALSIKHFKIPAIVLLSIIGTLFLANVIFFIMLIAPNAASETTEQSAMALSYLAAFK